MIFMDLGFRAGGGIGDVIPMVSWNSDINLFVGHFFFKVTFFILIIIILSNSCFGIIIDAFSDLRDKTNEIEEDKKNICFICQISRDSCLNRNIDYDYHVRKVHNPWDYVSFITYLMLNDPNEFNKSEFYVWTKISKSTNNIGWIPGEQEDDID